MSGWDGVTNPNDLPHWPGQTFNTRTGQWETPGVTPGPGSWQAGSPTPLAQPAPATVRSRAPITGGGGGGGGAPAPAGKPGVDANGIDWGLLKGFADAGMTPADVQALYAKQMVMSTYGYPAQYLNDPELGPILLKAATEGWAANKLEAAIQGTNWWKTTTDAQRAFDSTKAINPAESQAKVDAQVNVVHQAASTLGVTFAPDVMAKIAEESLRNGWDATQLSNAIGLEATKQPATETMLRAGQVGQNVRALADQYAVPVSDHAVDSWARQVATGAATPDDVTNYFKQQAMSLHPAIAQAIGRGVTVRQYADPYMQIAAQTLGIAPNSMSLTDPKWMAALDTIQPGGDRQPMTLDQWQTKLRTDQQYGYDKTQEAMSRATSMVQNLGQIFGKVA